MESSTWKGYYTMDLKKYPTEVKLTFAPDGKIKGDGKDAVGAFTANGYKKLDAVYWKKQYVGGKLYEYEGKMSVEDKKNVIKGGWVFDPTHEHAIGKFLLTKD